VSLSGKNPNFEVASWRASPSGRSVPGRRVLTLASGSVTRRAHGAFALIDGEDETVNRVHDILDCAFRRGSPADCVARGGEEDYVASVLGHIAGSALCRQQCAVVLAIWVGRDVVIGYLGGGRAYLVHELEEVEVTGSSKAALPRMDISVARVTIAHSQYLVLLNPAAAQRAQHLELRRTLHGCPSLQDAAIWLALEATARGAAESTVVAMQLVKARNVPWGAMDRRHSRLLGLLGGAAAVALLCAVAVVAHAMQARGSPVGGASSIPLGLHTQQATVSQALLAWRSTPNATGYRIKVGGQQYVSRKPWLKLAKGLRPGTDYRWQVQAQFQSQLGPMSQPAILHVPPLGVLPPPVTISPRGTYPARLAARVPFCWRDTLNHVQFDLFVVGGRIHLNRHLTSSVLSHSQGSLCVSQALPANTSYRWRVSSVAPGHVKSWTPWMHFSIAAPSPPRRARPVRSRSRPTAERVSQAPTPQPVYRPSRQEPIYRPPTPQPIYRPPTPQPVSRPPTPQPTNRSPTPQPTNRPPTPQPTHQPPTPQPTHQPPAPQPQPTAAAIPPPTPVPTPPVQTCPNPPNCS
jgi:hypothetical protein